MNSGQKFAALLAAFGISLPDKLDKQIKASGRRLGWLGSWQPLSAEHYFVDDHGTVHRRKRKRDRSISARQWKIRKKAQHREEAAAKAKV